VGNDPQLNRAPSMLVLSALTNMALAQDSWDDQAKRQRLSIPRSERRLTFCINSADSIFVRNASHRRLVFCTPRPCWPKTPRTSFTGLVAH
jgi:hypothetical protein